MEPPQENFPQGYQYLETIADGPLSSVHLATQTSLDRRVALKILKATNSQTMLNEARTIARLDHPHIIKIYDTGTFDEQHYISMEYVNGGDLSEHIYNNSLEQHAYIEYSRQLLSALQHAHDNDILHLDIKPANILLDHNNQVRLMDFGLATNSSENAESPYGTVGYAAPEVYDNQPNVTTDLFAAALVIFDLYNGCLPDIETGERHENKAIPPRILKAIEKATHPEPDQRYQSAEELLQALELAANVTHRLVLPASPANPSSTSNNSLQPNNKAPQLSTPNLEKTQKQQLKSAPQSSPNHPTANTATPNSRYQKSVKKIQHRHLPHDRRYLCRSDHHARHLPHRRQHRFRISKKLPPPRPKAGKPKPPPPSSKTPLIRQSSKPNKAKTTQTTQTTQTLTTPCSAKDTFPPAVTELKHPHKKYPALLKQASLSATLPPQRKNSQRKTSTKQPTP